MGAGGEGLGREGGLTPGSAPYVRCATPLAGGNASG
jgi:hypothetical protein